MEHEKSLLGGMPIGLQAFGEPLEAAFELESGTGTHLIDNLFQKAEAMEAVGT